MGLSKRLEQIRKIMIAEKQSLLPGWHYWCSNFRCRCIDQMHLEDDWYNGCHGNCLDCEFCSTCIQDKKENKPLAEKPYFNQEQSKEQENDEVIEQCMECDPKDVLFIHHIRDNTIVFFRNGLSYCVDDKDYILFDDLFSKLYPERYEKLMKEWKENKDKSS